MSAQTTRIMDLPDSHYQGSGSGAQPVQQQQPPALGNTTYAPIDNHPNPYGHPPPSVPQIPTPSFQDTMRMQSQPQQPQLQQAFPQQLQQQPQLQQQQQPQQQLAVGMTSIESLQSMPPQSLPNRDIPMLNEQYTHDEQIQPNYVPPITDSAKRTTEYIKQYDEATERKIRAHQEVQEKQSRFDILVEQGQIPLLVAILFFVFHIPMINAYVFQYASILSIYNNDGSFQVHALLLKSILFGGIFFVLNQAIQWLSDM